MADSVVADVNSGAVPSLSDATAAWLASFDQPAGTDTPIVDTETDAVETEVDDSVDESFDAQADEDEPEEVKTPQRGKQSQTVPYYRFQSVTEAKNKALEQAQTESQGRVAAETKAQMLEAQMAQVMAFINSQGGRMQPHQQEEEEPEFVDPYEQKLKELEAQNAEIRAYVHEQKVQNVASSYQQEWEQSVAMYPLAANPKAQPLVFKLLESDKDLSVKDAVIQVHNLLASALPPREQPKSKAPAAPPPKTAPSSARGPGRVGGANATVAPKFKSLSEAMAAYLREG